MLSFYEDCFYRFLHLEVKFGFHCEEGSKLELFCVNNEQLIWCAVKEKQVTICRNFEKKKKQVDFWITSEGRETEKSYIFF